MELAVLKCLKSPHRFYNGRNVVTTLVPLLYPQQTLFVGVYCFHVVRAYVRPCVHPSVRPSVTLCFLNKITGRVIAGFFHVVRASVRPCVLPSVTLCFLNNWKSHCWIFIKSCKHVHVCKTNTLDKKVRARGQFCWSYFPL